MMNIKTIKVHFTTYLFILLLLFSGYKKFIFPILFVFIIHELGHIFFTYIFKIKIIKFDIYPFGGILKLNKLLNIEIYKDFLIASGGIIFQLLLKIVIYKFEIINYYNNLFLLINILPIIPFDGSKILYIFVSKFLSFYRSRILYFSASLISIIIYLIYSYTNRNFNLVYFLFTFSFFIKEIKEFPYFINLFLLERYIHKFKYKKKKYYTNCNLLLLRRMVNGYFLDSYWKSEDNILSKKFDNSSYFW